MEFKFSLKFLNSKTSKVFLCFKGKKLSRAAEKFNIDHDNIFEKAFKSSYFNGEKNETLLLDNYNIKNTCRIVLVGLGDEKLLSTEIIENAGGSVFSLLKGTPDSLLEIIVGDLSVNGLNSFIISSHIAYGFLLRSWSFNKYKTSYIKEEKASLKYISLLTNQPDEAEKLFYSLEQVAEGVFLSQELILEPPNIIYPASMASRLQELAKFGVQVEILDLKELKKLEMGALLSVAQGSVQEPKVVILKWLGAGQGDPLLAFAGKGVTFDTGGISLKSSDGMWNLKYDMGGAAVVAGLIRALAGRKAKVNVIGVLGLVENMPSGAAQRPSDVVKSMSGKTLEILNTDAEGRLVLADILWYIQSCFKPQIIVDVATLTGSIIIALGSYFGGLFSNNTDLAQKLQAAGEKTGERLWLMPLDDRFEEEIRSDIADLRNHVPTLGPGSSMAAQFLKHFVNDTPWAHLDICGVIRTDKDMPIIPKGPTAFGVRLLNEFIQNHYEKYDCGSKFKQN